MLIASLMFACVQLAGACLCYNIAHRRTRTVALLLYGVGSFFLAGCLGNLPLFVQSILVTVVGLAAAGLGARLKVFLRSAVVCTALLYLGILALSVPGMMERNRLREKFPIESLSARLSYERRSAARVAEKAVEDESDAAGSETERSGPAPYVPKLGELEDALEQAEHWRWRDRSEALRQIHTSHVLQFIDSPGFGVGRMPLRMTEPEKYVDMQDPKTVPLPPGEFIDPDGTPPDALPEKPTREQPPPSLPSAPTPVQLRFMYEWGLVDFLNRRGWGYVQDLDHVAGFQSHRFRQIPPLPVEERSLGSAFQMAVNSDDRQRGTTGLKPNENWQVRKLELVSLLTHDEPCVYVSDALPRMDQAAEYEVRPLNGFEGGALKKLEAGEDIVSESSTNSVRMLGAMRAAKQCLKCHQVERGELLGAFSYLLERTRPVRPKRELVGPLF